MRYVFVPTLLKEEILMEKKPDLAFWLDFLGEVSLTIAKVIKNHSNDDNNPKLPTERD